MPPFGDHSGRRLRAYELRVFGIEGRVQRRIAILGVDDNDAVRAASAHLEGRAMELRCGGRLVRRFRESRG